MREKNRDNGIFIIRLFNKKFWLPIFHQTILSDFGILPQKYTHIKRRIAYKPTCFRTAKSPETESLLNPVISTLEPPERVSKSYIQPTPQSRFIYSENNIEIEERVREHPNLGSPIFVVSNPIKDIGLKDIKGFATDVI